MELPALMSLIRLVGHTHTMRQYKLSTRGRSYPKSKAPQLVICRDGIHDIMLLFQAVFCLMAPGGGSPLLPRPFKLGAMCAVPGCAGQRASMESTHSMGAQSTSTRSRRSSFALERASFDANRSSLERFGQRRNSTASRASMELAQVHCPQALVLHIHDKPCATLCPPFSILSLMLMFDGCVQSAPASLFASCF